jgi:hypothetical protein
MFVVGDVCQKVVTCAIWWSIIMEMENTVCPSAEPENMCGMLKRGRELSNTVLRGLEF